MNASPKNRLGIASGTLATLRQAGMVTSFALSLAVAAWIRWQAGRDDHGLAHQVDDPLAPQIARIHRADAVAAGKTREERSLGAIE